MARVSKPTRICVIVSVGVLLILSLVCLIAVLKFDALFTSLISKKLAIIPGSEVYKNWKSPGVPIYFSIYLYNLTNPNEVLNGSRPVFSEVGPYVYREDRQRVDVKFSEENPPKTVRFKHRIFYHFVREMSVGPDTEGLITSLDLPTAAMADGEMSWGLSILSSLFTYAAFTTQSPHDYIWGYEHGITQTCYSTGKCATPFAGLMANNNGTKVVDYLIDSGAYDISRVGKVLEANGMTELPYWHTPEANMINGTDGSVIRPNLDIGSRIDFFVPDLCRSFYSVAVGKTKATNNKNIELLIFQSPSVQAMSADLYPPNKAFCPKEQAGPPCPPTGMIPISPCSGGDKPVPVFASQPHFLGADPSIRAQLDGIQEPSKENDSTVVLVEPNTGFVLEAYKRLQINMYVKNTGQLDGVYEKMNGPFYFPLSWFTEIAVVDEQPLNRIHSLIIQPKRLIPLVLCSIGSFAVALAVLVIAVLIVCSRLQHHARNSSVMMLSGVGKQEVTVKTVSPRGAWNSSSEKSVAPKLEFENEKLLGDEKPLA